jgi:hypothetical protein
MGITGISFQAGTTISVVGVSSLTLSQPTLSTVTTPLVLTNFGGNTISGSVLITCVSFQTKPNVGRLISGSGIPAGATVETAPDNLDAYQHGTGKLTISVPATISNNTALTLN